MSLLVGKPAPEFTTRAYYQGAFKDISLSDFKGKWIILMFYPGDFTFVCATEVAAAAEDHEAFESLGATTITISVDSPHVHKAWKEQELSEIAAATGLSEGTVKAHLSRALGKVRAEMGGKR